jgi:hypothetical protein
VTGSVRGVWLWLRDQGLQFPLQPAGYLHGADITWVEPTYDAVHNMLTHPAYAGAYVFGKICQQRYVGKDDRMRIRRRRLPQGEWEVLITDHHRGFIGWDTYQTNQARIGNNIHPMAHEPGTGAVRECCALLQGLAICGTCGRRLAVYYDGPASPPPATTAPAPVSWFRGAAPGTCGSVASRSTPRWPRRSWRRWPSGDGRSNKPATGPAEPSAVRTASSCYAPCWRRSPSACTATTPKAAVPRSASPASVGSALIDRRFRCGSGTKPRRLMAR